MISVARRATGSVGTWHHRPCGLILWTLLTTATCMADELKSANEINATTLQHKVLCGYQGWFRCPGDLADKGRRHWSRDGRKIDPGTLTFEMWPDIPIRP